MSAEHTPGPWTIDLDEERRSGEYRIDQFDAARTYIARGLDGIDAEDAANARLIAAAPDLLAALETATTKRDPGRDWRYCTVCDATADIDDRIPIIHEDWCIVGAAIRKARGE